MSPTEFTERSCRLFCQLNKDKLDGRAREDYYKTGDKGLATYTPDELAYRGDGIPRTAGGNVLPWVSQLLIEEERERQCHKH
ncbi:hypothetical protein [Bifidobacterium canis]|uniref:Uncharacterized protein n=1 Tax=Bifidobacterium canis TaxID=2610880 RepID=A0A7K1J462_9BIFI|nr:hypothetical protein [Bifidobacterium canis]MUH59443.1 hypothetical protein [Bifidobacterium canis]